jgi:hypothetical protein
MKTPARARYGGYRFPAEIIGHAVWLYFRFPLGLRMVEKLLAARGIIVSHETVRQWARKFGQQSATAILVFSQSDSLNERLFRKPSRGINHDFVSRMDRGELRRATSKVVSYSSRRFGCNPEI